MQITEVMLTPKEFDLIGRALSQRWGNKDIDREDKETEGLKALIDGLNLLKDASGYVLRPVRTSSPQL